MCLHHSRYLRPFAFFALSLSLLSPRSPSQDVP
jgi:hypothetical protein